MPARQRPVDGLLRLLCAIADARGIPNRVRHLLYGFARFADHRSYEAWPTNATLAHAAGVSLRTLQSALSDAAALGILQPVEHPRGGRSPSGHGLSTRRRINIEALEALASEPDESPDPPADAGEKGATVAPLGCEGCAEGCDRCTPRAREPHGGDATVAHKQTMEPSIHQANEETKKINHPTGSDSIASREDGWMPGGEGGPSEESPPAGADPIREKLALLRRHGIKGPNAKQLAESPALTVQTINDTFHDLASDPGVRSRAAVAYGRLCELAGIEPNRRPKLSRSEASAVGKLEALRRRTQRPTGASSLAEAFGDVLAQAD